MRRDRLATVLRVRVLLERQRLAEQAAAVQAVTRADDEHQRARASRDAAAIVPGTSMVPQQLTTTRAGAIALDDRVDRAVEGQRVAGAAAAAAERALIAAAIDRRSAERLNERRAAAIAKDEAKVETRRADEVALQQWRSRR